MTETDLKTEAKVEAPAAAAEKPPEKENMMTKVLFAWLYHICCRL